MNNEPYYRELFINLKTETEAAQQYLNSLIESAGGREYLNDIQTHNIDNLEGSLFSLKHLLTRPQLATFGGQLLTLKK